ncbi:tRNA lysidine(34) synthetase TilS [Curtobacterium sp. A7_M15]|uniref:tRNA lysidine(34) synthetase TilS n=1 Tax=Curtobacterium sp. A7_M15 TaxID=3065241 RepID=UPI002737FD38|nr:tRNA lysidine(34) synthetase TilS [Curtobacterium sp. A7_M15]MDP4332312.1 tRNA lysidine(34) synthetase TilS [Curtobacterium sp. A7_M15]
MNTPRPRLDPAVADTRRAVRSLLAQALDEGTVRSGDLVLVALSGGPDSLALAAATAFEAPKQDLRAGAVVVDHALQAGSEAVASRASRQASELGLAPVTVRRVAVGSTGGPEAAAREARHASIALVAADVGSPLVLFGHTLDDQAESVLLGLARGSGPDSLSGMAPLTRRQAGPAYGRPLLGLRRHTTRQACAAAGLAPWDDPQNADPAYARVRVRNVLLPALERELGAGVPEALARTADQLREDSAALDHFAEEMAEDLAEHSEAGISLSVRELAANPPALRQRLVRLAVESEFGVTLSRVQTLEVCRLVTDWSGQGPIDLPGVQASRSGDRLAFTAG